MQVCVVCSAYAPFLLMSPQGKFRFCARDIMISKNEGELVEFALKVQAIEAMIKRKERDPRSVH